MTQAVASRPKTAKASKAPKVKDQPLFIAGKWQDSRSGKTFPTLNPATGETLWKRELTYNPWGGATVGAVGQIRKS